MTYQPSLNGDAIAKPNGFAFVLPQRNSSASAGSQIPWSSVQYQKGSGFITISSGAITLQSGYIYYVEATAQTHSESGISATVPQGIKYQWYQSGSPIGSWGRVASYHIDSYSNEVGDEKSICMIDATSAAVTIELKVTSTFGAALLGVNYEGIHSQYGGYGRAVVLQLQA